MKSVHVFFSVVNELCFWQGNILVWIYGAKW